MSAALTLWQKHMRKSLVHKEEIIGLLIQPVLWVVLFGLGMVLGGVVVGGTGSALSLRKYLRLI